MINIYLDDLRPAPDGFILVKNVLECIKLIKENKSKINILSLDHDLGENQPTGYNLTLWLAGQYQDGFNYFPRKIFLHTANPVGRMNMLQLLERYKPDNVKVYNSPIPNI